MGRDDRWQHLVHLAFRLSERLSEGGEAFDAGEEVVRALDSALEVFGPEIDPVDDFEGYALRRFALALRQSLRRK